MTQWKNQLKNKTKLTGLWARNRATIQQVLISKFALGHESYWDVREMGPWYSDDLVVDSFTKGRSVGTYWVVRKNTKIFKVAEHSLASGQR